MNWRSTFELYADRRLIRIFGLGLASGFPWVMIGSAMSAWLSEEGLSRTNIGFFGFIFIAYSINFLWSPIVDRVNLPVLGGWLGQRRSWIVLMQVLVAASCAAIALVSPADELALAKTVALLLALAAATQDIAIDAYRIDSLPQDSPALMSAGSAMATAGWWTGFAGLGAIPLLLVDLDAWDWPSVYGFMALAMLALALVPLFSPEPHTSRVHDQSQRAGRYQFGAQMLGAGRVRLFVVALGLGLTLLAWMIMGFPGLALDAGSSPYWVSGLVLLLLLVWLVLETREVELRLVGVSVVEQAPAKQSVYERVFVWMAVSFVEPLAEFFRRNGLQLALSVLFFIFLFKIGEAFLGRMSIVFYKELGFSNSDIAVYSKLVSWWVTIVFSLIGSVVTIRYGILKGLFVGGVAMAASNLMFALLAMVGPYKELLLAAVILDGFTTAWSTVAFVAFLSMMCNRAFTASQYALMASLGTLGRTFMASYSGWVVDTLDGNWALFFVLTALMVLPSLAFLYWTRDRLRALSAEF